MITVNNITKSFDGKVIIEDVNCTFTQGKTNLIIGASGTGKSVLLRCMVGLVIPDSGSVVYDDRDFTNCTRNERTDIRRDIGMLFQGGALFDSMNVEENVIFPLLRSRKFSESEKQDRVNYCLERVDLAGSNKKMPSELSGGMKKRVGIARAIVNNSKYLYCDEPNSGLDPQTSILIDELIQDITEELNITTIVVTHDMNSVMEIGQHIMFMHQGKKIWEGDNKEILHSDVEELNDFIYANKFLSQFRDKV